MKPIRPIQPGGNLWAEDENVKTAELVRLSKLQVEGGELAQLASGPQLIIPGQPPRIRARIIATNTITLPGGCSPAYGWWEQRPAWGGCWEDIPELEGGRRGDAAVEPAYEANGIPVTSDVSAWLYPHYFENLSTSVKPSWFFDAPACCCEPPVEPCDECDLECIQNVCLTISNVLVNGSEAFGDQPYRVTLGWSGSQAGGLIGFLQLNSPSGPVNFFVQLFCVNGLHYLSFGTSQNLTNPPQQFGPLLITSSSPLAGTTDVPLDCYTVITSPRFIQVCTPITFVQGPCAT